LPFVIFAASAAIQPDVFMMVLGLGSSAQTSLHGSTHIRNENGGLSHAKVLKGEDEPSSRNVCMHNGGYRGGRLDIPQLSSSNRFLMPLRVLFSMWPCSFGLLGCPMQAVLASGSLPAQGSNLGLSCGVGVEVIVNSNSNSGCSRMV
jgi:hypothetical protein